MAVLAVCREPVSGSSSLLIREETGIFSAERAWSAKEAWKIEERSDTWITVPSGSDQGISIVLTGNSASKAEKSGKGLILLIGPTRAALSHAQLR